MGKKRKPAPAGKQKRIYVKAPPVKDMTDEQIDAWVAKFLEAFHQEFPEVGRGEPDDDQQEGA